MRPPALGYLRADLSGVSQAWHEKQVRSRAHRLGYDLRKIIVFTDRTDDPITRLIRWARKEGVDAVVVHDLDHLGGDIPRSLLLCCDVITVAPEAHHTRELAGPPMDFMPTRPTGGGEYIDQSRT